MPSHHPPVPKTLDAVLSPTWLTAALGTPTVKATSAEEASPSSARSCARRRSDDSDGHHTPA